MDSFESKHNYLMLLSLFKLMKLFGSCTGPSSGHKVYNRSILDTYILFYGSHYFIYDSLLSYMSCDLKMAQCKG